ncbi:MEDS domain-containing protein [Micromonospora sp. R77]|uniref:MEDS domain-containing protein n=1 Tax=Micromonospora sp. R77 TaxID=2925836 RepID=UPI001F61DF8D|nr:MEDS domain-containing protein [Micromonospora sp. R77]MCI4065163.1 MEDS domain-containing protein [Micromonospora sp. R77]
MTSDVTLSGGSGHICWTYDDPTELDRRAVAFLAAGLAAGERVWLVADGTAETLTRRLERLPDLTGALRDGSVSIVPIRTAYPDGHVVDPEAQVRAYSAATDEALAAGHTGLRVVAEATSLVRTLPQRRAFLRYEHLIDRYMHRRPMSAICAYDRRELGEQAVAELACLHAEENTDGLFQLHAGGPDDGGFALAGELDPSNHALFAEVLDLAHPDPVDGRLTVDARHLHYIDHRSLIHLRDHARRQGATAVLRTSRSAAARLVELLGLTEVRVEAA